jgi:putative lipoic acid-binding regulatory protein
VRGCRRPGRRLHRISAASRRLNDFGRSATVANDRDAAIVARHGRVGQDPIVNDDEKRAIDLLEANHTFPGDFSLTVIALNSETVTAALVESVQEGLAAPLDEAARETRSSSGGKYLSHRLRVPCASAADVIRLYARIRRVEGVVTML